MASKKSDVADAFKKHYSQVGRKLANEIIPPKNTGKILRVMTIHIT